jgi:hypothetical protein
VRQRSERKDTYCTPLSDDRGYFWSLPQKNIKRIPMAESVSLCSFLEDEKLTTNINLIAKTALSDL